MALRVSNVTAQVMFSPTVQNRTVAQSITFIEEPFRRTVRMANFTVQLLMPGEPQLLGVASNNMALTQGALFFLAIADRQVPLNTLNLQQNVVSPNWPQVYQSLTFSQALTTNLLGGTAIHCVCLKQSAHSCMGVSWMPYVVEQELNLLQSTGFGKPVTVNQSLVLFQTVENRPATTEQIIDLVQSASAGKGHDIAQTLSLQQDINTENEFLRQLGHAAFLKQAMTYYLDTPCATKTYNRFDGEGEGPGIREKNLNFPATLALETTSGAKTLLLLRNPETDDRDRIGFQRINRETRGGELNVFGDPIWGKVNTLLFTIVALPDGDKCPDKIYALLDFFQNTLGQEIKLHDWKGVSWRGVVTTPDETATEDADGYWTISFEFEGEPLEGIPADNVFEFDEELEREMIFDREFNQDVGLEETAHAGGALYVSAGNTLALNQSVNGSEHITTIMFDNLTGSSLEELHNTLPDTAIGSSRWSAHENFLHDGTMSGPIAAGAYYPFTPSQGKRYQLTCNSFFEVSHADGKNALMGFYEDVVENNTVTGPKAWGGIDPTTAKAVHVRRDLSGGPNHAYRLGSPSNGAWTTSPWTDATLREYVERFLNMRVILDTTGGAGNWTVTFYAKSVLSPDYTAVSPEVGILDENIRAFGFSNDNGTSEFDPGNIRLQEITPITTGA